MAYIRAAHPALSSLFNIQRRPPLKPGRHGVWKVGMTCTCEMQALKMMPDELSPNSAYELDNSPAACRPGAPFAAISSGSEEPKKRKKKKREAPAAANEQEDGR